MQSFINIKSRGFTKVKISKKLWESNLFSHLDKSFLKVGVGSYLKMQYEYAISDTAIAEKKLSLFAAPRDAFTVVVVLHLEPSRKKFFW